MSKTRTAGHYISVSKYESLSSLAKHITWQHQPYLLTVDDVMLKLHI